MDGNRLPFIPGTFSERQAEPPFLLLLDLLALYQCTLASNSGAQVIFDG